MYEFDFLSCDGKTKIKAFEWLPDGQPKGILQISHGLSEHTGRYGGFAEYMAQNGYIVAGHDHLGHGLSAAYKGALGFFGELGGWDLCVGDLRRMTDLLRERHKGLHMFLLGHSMGSMLARSYIIKHRSGLDGVILSGTGQTSPLTVGSAELLAKFEAKRHGLTYRSKRLNALIFGKYCDKILPKRTVLDWLTRDGEAVDKVLSDPLCGRMPSVSLFMDIMHGARYAASAKNLKRMKKDLPVFFFSGDMDPFGDYGKGVIRVYRSFLAAGMKDVTMKLYHEGRHEMLFELNRDEVYGDVLRWIENKTGRI